MKYFKDINNGSPRRGVDALTPINVGNTRGGEESTSPIRCGGGSDW